MAAQYAHAVRADMLVILTWSPLPLGSEEAEREEKALTVPLGPWQ